MTKYEYRVIDARGVVCTDESHDLASVLEARELVEGWDRRWPDDAPHRIQRLEITEWEDVT